MDDDSSLIETTISSEQVLDGVLLKAHQDRVKLPNGAEATREWIDHPGAAVVIALLDNGKLIFERQFRYPVRQICLEMPAGKIESGEPALDTARRELQEETGYKARRWFHLGTTHPCIGYSNERIEIFLAHGLSYVGGALDEEEFLEVVEMSLSDAVLAVRDGEITDGKTIAALFWAEKLLTGAWEMPG